VASSIRIDQALNNQVKSDAAAEHWTTAGQVEFRAKVGGAALDNPDLPASFIADALASMAEATLPGCTVADPVWLVCLEALGSRERCGRELKRTWAWRGASSVEVRDAEGRQARSWARPADLPRYHPRRWRPGWRHGNDACCGCWPCAERGGETMGGRLLTAVNEEIDEW